MAGLKFRILLDSKDKNEIFRDVLISDSDNFESFYKAILNSYNFTEDQMASFYMSNENWTKDLKSVYSTCLLEKMTLKFFQVL